MTIEEPGVDIQLGMTASVLMGARMDATLFRLPLTALGESGGKPAVWRVEGGVVKPVPVGVVRYEEQGVILSGPLSDKDEVLTAGVHLVVEGQSVKALPRKPVKTQS